VTGYIGYRFVDYDKPETLPIGRLPGGVPVFRDAIGDAFVQAVGPPPAAPVLMGPGEMLPSYTRYESDNGNGVKTTTDLVTGWTYNPGPTDYDTAVVAEFAAVVTEWNQHAANVKTALDLMIANDPYKNATRAQ
jgi:hypothetical protein